MKNRIVHLMKNLTIHKKKIKTKIKKKKKLIKIIIKNKSLIV